MIIKLSFIFYCETQNNDNKETKSIKDDSYHVTSIKHSQKFQNLFIHFVLFSVFD